MALTSQILRLNTRIFLSRHVVQQNRFKSVKTMDQVEVDVPETQQKLGRIQLDMIRKAEEQNKSRAKRHIRFRKKDWAIGGFCIGLALSIYGYTIWAIKQEKFLDDFEVPNPIPDEEED